MLYWFMQASAIHFIASAGHRQGGSGSRQSTGVSGCRKLPSPDTDQIALTKVCESMAEQATGRMLRLQAILREHTELVLSGSVLGTSLAQLARGAAELAGCPAHLALVRVLDPVSSVHLQDVWAVPTSAERRVGFERVISKTIRVSR